MATPYLPIKTQRMTLRCFERGDIDAVVSYYALPEVQRYLGWKARDRVECKLALDAMCGQIVLNRPGDSLMLALVRSIDDLVMGQVALRWHDATASQGELRFLLHPLYRRQGYGAEAVGAILDLGFNHFRIHRIFARCDGRNEASAKLLKGLGMRLEAHYREHALFQGEWDEELHFAILDREWGRSTKVRDLTVHRVA